MTNVFESNVGFTDVKSTLSKTKRYEINVDLNLYSDKELCTLRAMIDERLPVNNLKHINGYQESVSRI